MRARSDRSVRFTVRVSHCQGFLRARALRFGLAALISATLMQALVTADSPDGSPAHASAATGTGGQFASIQGRILDTRNGTGGYATPMPAGVYRSIAVASQIGIPSSGVSAVAVSFTVVSPVAGGQLHADRDGVTPNTTVTYMNYSAGATQSNTAVLPVGSDGKIQAETTSSTDLLIDVQGYYTAGEPAAGGYVPITPKRLVDTRNGTGLPQAQLQPTSTSTIQVTGLAGIPTGASAVVVNFTVVNQSNQSWYMPYPADETRPPGSMNYPATVDANGAEVGLSTTGTSPGSFKLYNSAATIDLLVDVVGYFTAEESAGAFTPGSARVLDTRTAGHSQLVAGGTATYQVAGVAGVPDAGMSAVTTNIAVINAGTHASHLVVWASGTSQPATSALNYDRSATTSNMITTALGADGAIQVYNAGADPVDIVVDVEGWYALPAPFDISADSMCIEPSQNDCATDDLTTSAVPTLDASTSDPSNRALKYDFEVWKTDGNETPTSQFSGGSDNNVPSGDVARWKISAPLTEHYS